MKLERIATRVVPWLIGAACAFAGYRGWQHDKVLFDDAFITFRYADNLVHGHGPVFNPGERVEGYTNFSWMLIAAAGIALTGNPVSFMQGVGVICHMLALALIGWALTSWLLAREPDVPDARAAEASEARRWASLFALPLLAVLVAPKSFAPMAGSGLETAFVCVLLTATGVVLAFGDVERRETRYALAALLSLALLTRLDCIGASAAVGLALMVDQRARGRSFVAAARAVVACLWPVAAVLLLWSAGRYAYYGDLLPNTYYAKAADQLHLKEGWNYVTGFVRTQPQIVPLGLLIPAAVSSQRPAIRRFGVFAVSALLIELAFTIKVGGDFMEYRFIWQQFGLFVLAAAAGLAAIAERSIIAAFVVTGAVLSVANTRVDIDKHYTMQTLKEMNYYANVGTQVGKRLRQALPPDTIIATTLAGTLAYYSRLTTIDQWGLNDRYVAHRPWSGPPLVRGHVKFAPVDYLRKRGVNLYIGHPILCSCDAPCREHHPNVFLRLDKHQCMRSWYLTQTPKLTLQMCAHPKDFLLAGVTCPPAPPPSPTAAASGTDTPKPPASPGSPVALHQ